LYSELQSSYYL